MTGKSSRYSKKSGGSRRHNARGEKYAAVKEKNAADRKVVSYEDIPIDEYDEATPIQPEVVKRLLKVLLIIFACVIALLVILNWSKLSPENVSRFIQYDLLGISQGEGYPAKINGNEVVKGDFMLMDEKTPVYVSDTSVVLLNDNAGQRQNIGHAFANPVLRTSRDYALVFNAGGTGMRIFTHSDSVSDISLENKIFCADISDEGSYAVVAQTDDYLSKLTAYTKDKNEKYVYSFADYYINTVSINSSGTRAIVSGVSAQKGSLISAVYILDFSQDDYIAKYEIPDNIIYDVEIFDNGNAAAIGKKESYFFDIENNKKNIIKYESKTLTDYQVMPNYGVVFSLARYPDGRDCDILAISPRGETVASFQTGLKANSVSMSSENIAVSIGNEIYLYKQKNGATLGQKKCKQSIKKIQMANDTVIYALGVTEIQKIELGNINS